MLPYLLVLIFVMTWMLLESASVNRKSFWIPLLLLSLLASVRSYRVGTDTGTYTGKFRHELSTYNYSFREDLEYGYQLLEYMLLHFTHNYFWLFLVCSLIVVSCYLSIIKRYSVNYILSVFLYITIGSYTFFFNGLRQGIAMAIVVLATPYLLEKKTIKFLSVVGLASFFHTSALFIIPFYFLLNSNIKNHYKPLISLLISVLASQLVLTYIASTNPRYEGYAEASEKAGGLLILGFHTAISLALHYISYLYRIKNSDFNKLLTLHTSGVLFIIPIALIGTNPSGPQRLLSYFTWTAILLIPFALKRINNIIIYISAICLALLYFILTTSKFSGLTPYTLNPIFKVF